MKIKILAISLCCMLFLSSCLNKSTIDTPKENVSSTTPEASIGELTSSTLASPKAPPAEGIIIEEFNATYETGLTTVDFETIYSMSKQALEEFYCAKYGQNSIDFDKYISNENLKQHMTQMVEIEKFNHIISTSCTFGVNDIDWLNKEQLQYVYLDLAIIIKLGVGAEGQTCQMLIENQNGKLKIVDWYFGGIFSSATLTRERLRKIEDPNFWNDEGKYKASLEKGKELIRNKL
ncbi:MAG: hypothetical protein WAX04_10530 [Oscillospiraceae bacterium]